MNEWIHEPVNAWTALLPWPAESGGVGGAFLLKRGRAPGFQNEAIVTHARCLAATLAL